MKLIDKTAKVPARSLPSERDEEGNLTNAIRAEFGRAAVDVGSPDRGQNDDRTDAVDAVTNILHWLDESGIDPEPALESALGHFRAEVPLETVESRALGILAEAGIEASLFHSGGGFMVVEIHSNTVPGRIVWVTDSEGERGGPFAVVAYPTAEKQEAIEPLSGACSEDDLLAHVRRALTEPYDLEEPNAGRRPAMQPDRSDDRTRPARGQLFSANAEQGGEIDGT